MPPNFSKPLSSPINDQIRKELDNYQEALKADAEFHVLKSIKDRIKLLEEKLQSQNKKKL